jgi:hypothetical protein
LSQGVQLTAKLAATSNWLDRYENGTLWEQPDFVSWIALSGLAVSAVQYRAIIVAWWADQVAIIRDEATTPSTPKYVTLIETLSSILRGPTSVVGLAMGNVLNQLTAVLVARAKDGDHDPLVPRLLDAISALAFRTYYLDQVNDLVADLVESIQLLQVGEGDTATYDEVERTRALRALVTALKGVLVEADASKEDVYTALPLLASISTSSNNLANSQNGQNGVTRPPLEHDEQGTIRGNGVLLKDSNGLRSKKEAAPGLDGMDRPVVRIETTGQRRKVSKDAFIPSLDLLSSKDEVVKKVYEDALHTFVVNELGVPSHQASSAIDGLVASWAPESSKPKSKWPSSTTCK